MSRQGYLILHEKRNAPRVCFFSLEDGFLRYYATDRCSKQVGEVRLSGCKIVVKAQRRADGIPNSFVLETRKVNVKDRSYTLGAPVRLELSSHTNEDRQDWGKVLFSWQRYYWRDPSAQESAEADRQLLKSKAELEEVLIKFYPGESVTNNQSSNNAGISIVGTTASAALSAAKQPITFLRKNASSLRRSFSMYLPSTTASTASTVSSTSSPTSTSKGKVEAVASGPEATDCVKDKVVLATVAYTTATIYRGDNQRESCAD